MTNWTEMTDDELANEAQTGMRGQGAIVEALRRHRAKVEDLDRSSSRLAGVGLALTAIATVLAAVQLWAVFFPPTP